MSAHNTISPESLITVKVTHDGTTRRLKVALKDVGPSVFQGKLRELLGIPTSQQVIFERFSDSAGNYVTLDPQNTAVYKQLYRAAKAKLKLRIRIITLQDSAASNNEGSSEQVTLPPSYSTVHVNQHPAPTPSPKPSTDTVQIDDVVAKAVTTYCKGSEFTAQLRETIREEVEKQVPDTSASMPELISLPQSSYVSPVQPVESVSTPVQALLSSVQNTSITSYVLYCNACQKSIHGIHWHCDQCESGDYDLCSACVDKSVHCNDANHCLKKREIFNGKIISDSVELKMAQCRVCNCCLKGVTVTDSVRCAACRDYDLCLACLRTAQHGHNPSHSFVRGHESVDVDEKLLRPGGITRHNAYCDNCDKPIFGVRHKCIDCPDWDYCNQCVSSSQECHPGHRFVPVYDNNDLAPLNYTAYAGTVHYGVYCDGPICAKIGDGRGSFIRGVRYKCAICPDTDLCGTCEASPLNKHNSTHPLIKLKTPIRNVLVTTTDNTDNVMGDVQAIKEAPEKEAPNANAIKTTEVQTIADVKPTEDFAAPLSDRDVSESDKSMANLLPEPEPVVKDLPLSVESPKPLCAAFIVDEIPDGTVLPVGQDFTQTWYMKNSGSTNWPAGVTLKFVGGDYMFLKSEEDKLNVTITQSEVAPEETVGFSVGLSATWPPNKSYISYWRLTAPDGTRFGDNIWCIINVADAQKKSNSHNGEDACEDDRISDSCSSRSVVDVESVKDAKEDLESTMEALAKSQASSEMVFPKLPVESPVHSLESLSSFSLEKRNEHSPAPLSPVSSSHKTFALSEAGDVEEEVDVSSLGDHDTFSTDEEYDILDASDEDFEEC